MSERYSFHLLQMITNLERQRRTDCPVHLGHVEVRLGQVVDADEPIELRPGTKKRLLKVKG